MSNYARGRRLEYKIRDELEGMGAELVVRSAGSKGPIDLIAFFPLEREIYLVQVKGKGLSGRELAKLRREMGPLGGDYRVKTIVCHGGKMTVL